MHARRPVALLTVLVTLVAATPVSPAAAESTVDAARALLARYDEDPSRIDRARDLLEAEVARAPRVETLVMLARVYFHYGDVRATTTDARLAAYDRGRALARRAVELAPRDADAHLMYAVNTGRWGETKGVLRALFLLPTVREEMETILALDPRLPPGHVLAGNLFLEVPVMLGGDRARAEEHFRKALEADPGYTGARVDLARVLLATRRAAEARRELARVLEERAPTSRADWAMKDVPRARALLESLRENR